VSASLELVPTDSLVERLRLVKDEFEATILREAASRLSEVARGVLSDLARPGGREHDMAAEIDWRLKRAGFERTAFDTIVAAGPNAALPHAHPTDRRVEAGDLLLLDFGGVLHGYCVDLTRTVAIGPVRDEYRRIYRAVYDAQRAAIASVRPGCLTDAVDAAARDRLTASGLGEAFRHSTGHGLGLEVHEEPRLGRTREGGPPAVPLEAGMVCTIEPGAYLPDLGGVRLEDDVRVSADGCQVLTDVPFDDRLL
jgi:Xaa-Pro aminopeptidase